MNICGFPVIKATTPRGPAQIELGTFERFCNVKVLVDFDPKTQVICPLCGWFGPTEEAICKLDELIECPRCFEPVQVLKNEP